MTSDNTSNTMSVERSRSLFTHPSSTNITHTADDRILTDLGGKTRVMELMSHPNPDVRYQALISVQRLVSHPWAAV